MPAVCFSAKKTNKLNYMKELIKTLEEIKEHQMQTVQLARTTKVYKLAEIAINQALNIPLVSKPFVIEWADLYVNGSGTQTILNCEDIPKAINDFIEENPDCEIISVK
tara:strand:- start:15 stop:338 length:324 start_codon:yes stop_codon:yes gene_type:complete